LGDLGLTDRNDPFTEIIAKEVIQVASRGVRNTSEIRAQVLVALGNRLASEGSEGIDTQVPGTK
jgi:hypothetical protein